MKTLKQMNNVEKARVLHTWFPDEIPALLETMQGMSETILQNEAQHRAGWEEGLFGFDFWLQLAGQAERIIQLYGKGLHKKGRLFSDQLFDHYQAIYTVHCLIAFAKTRQLANRKFFLATDLLFDI
ncbi:hypothetical protein GR160_07720 [Flavobacterium sp. Sd200]|uniref:hypothetical protein n=1 Tax=Flavobacterium sp. Sd200 TaxID=2692211 RepID=UPI00136D2E60|nr:hypothetical protein [Flavobacterium sp. Sd200]MXN91116.1 hypothetical protein [Flavobacterium sp. Sd200]